MRSRLSCWLHGHPWAPVGEQIYEDIFDNQWRLQHCTQCNARRRILHRRWDQR